MRSMKRRSCAKWTVEAQTKKLSELCASLGHFPTQTECYDLGLSGFYASLGRRGGIKDWWIRMERAGYSHKLSDTEIGWNGEDEVRKILSRKGFKVCCPSSSKQHWDLLIGDAVRADVKSTKRNTEWNSGAWYWRIGKMPSVDLVILFQSDTKDMFLLPWFAATCSNMTIGMHSQYDCYKNNFDMLKAMVDLRVTELKILKPLMDVENDLRKELLSRIVKMREAGKSFSKIGTSIGTTMKQAHKLYWKAKGKYE